MPVQSAGKINERHRFIGREHVFSALPSGARTLNADDEGVPFNVPP
jgi:hypothetical protein